MNADFSLSHAVAAIDPTTTNSSRNHVAGEGHHKSVACASSNDDKSNSLQAALVKEPQRAAAAALQSSLLVAAPTATTTTAAPSPPPPTITATESSSRESTETTGAFFAHFRSAAPSTNSTSVNQLNSAQHSNEVAFESATGEKATNNKLNDTNLAHLSAVQCECNIRPAENSFEREPPENNQASSIVAVERQPTKAQSSAEQGANLGAKAHINLSPQEPSSPSSCSCQHWTPTNTTPNEEQQHYLNSQGNNSFLFWKILSNLPKSITQRTKSITSSSLAPEVVCYLESRGDLQRQQDQHEAALACCTEAENVMNDFAGNRHDLGRDENALRLNDGSALACQEEAKMKLAKALNLTKGAACGGGGDAANTTTSTTIESSNKTESTCGPHSAQANWRQSGSNRQTSVARDTSGNSRLIKIIETPSSVEMTNPVEAAQADEEQKVLNNQRKPPANVAAETSTTKHPHQIKLSIATTTTTTTTSGRSSAASSLSSCILSADSSVSEVRLKWGKKMDFLLSIIGFAVDLANIWRFPYLVYKNGGGVFLIPYITMLIFGGIPLFFLELCLGQFVKKGPITVWNKICPSMKGVGYCSILISWYVSFYYNVLIAWSVYFIYRSLQSFGGKMPWEECDNSWNSKACVSISQLKGLCSTRNESLEACRKEQFSNLDVTSPASEFFVKELSQIDQSTGLDDMGYLRPELVLCTMIVYLLHYFSLFKGLETSGKVVWVTATAPYMILSILLVRGLFLPGASMGIEYYLSPKLEKLAEPQVWVDAAVQVFYSIGVGFGVHLTYASFNSHNNNCYRDCLMTSAVNAATSVYSGLVVFVYLGYMAKNLGIEIDKVASEGYSLVFEVYPEALTTLPFARFWSILFFIMLLTLGIDSAMGGLEAVITGLEDEFRFAKRLSRGQLTGLVIVSSFLPALISCTQGGAYTLFWFDIYSAGVSLLFSALFETIGVVYCYGLKKFIPDIESMLGRRPHLFYIICWKYISPLFLIGVIFMSIYTATVPTYRNYTFPTWSVILGWCLAFSSVSAIPIVAAWHWYAKWHQPDKSTIRKRSSRGSSSITSSRHGSKTNKSPNHFHHKSVSVSGLGDGHQAPSGLTMTTTTILTTTKSGHENQYPTTTTYEGNKRISSCRTGEDML